MHFNDGVVQAHLFHSDGQDLLLLQPGEDPVQHPGLAPAVHPRIDRMPVAKMLWQSSPFATVLPHIQQSIEQLQISHADIAVLPRQAISDALKLTLCDLHAPQECTGHPDCQLVLTGPSAKGGWWRMAVFFRTTSDSFCKFPFHYLGFFKTHSLP